MSFRNRLLILGALALATIGCTETPSNLENKLKSSPSSTCRGGNYHREYGVFATDDSPVNTPELADKLFEGKRFYCCPYHNYSGSTRIKGNTFRIGQLPKDLLEKGPKSDFEQRLLKASGRYSSNDPKKDLRVAIIFTGEQFAKQTRNTLKDISPSDVEINGHKLRYWATKAGHFYQTNLAKGKQVGILVYGHARSF